MSEGFSDTHLSLSRPFLARRLQWKVQALLFFLSAFAIFSTAGISRYLSIKEL
jgi:hypothetical protein